MARISPVAWEVYSNSMKSLLLEPFANVAQLFYQWYLKAAAWEFGRESADIPESLVNLDPWK